MRISKKKIQDIKWRYGINEEQYKKFFIDQNQKCGICQKYWETINDRDICIDHCHNSGKVRGLLCNVCNMALGNIGTLLNHYKLLEYHNKSQGLENGREQILDSARKAEIVRERVVSEKQGAQSSTSQRAQSQ